MDEPGNVIIVLWLAWLVSWLIAARWTAATASRGTIADWLRYMLPLWAGAMLLIARPPFLGRLSQPLLPEPIAVAWSGAVLVLVGLGWTWWVRIHLGRLWSSTARHGRAARLVGCADRLGIADNRLCAQVASGRTVAVGNARTGLRSLQGQRSGAGPATVVTRRAARVLAATVLVTVVACHAQGTAKLNPPDAVRWLYQACGVRFAHEPVVLEIPSEVSATRRQPSAVVSAMVVVPAEEMEQAVASLAANRSLHQRGMSETRYSYESYEGDGPAKECELDRSRRILYFRYLE